MPCHFYFSIPTETECRSLSRLRLSTSCFSSRDAGLEDLILGESFFPRILLVCIFYIDVVSQSLVGHIGLYLRHILAAILKPVVAVWWSVETCQFNCVRVFHGIVFRPFNQDSCARTCSSCLVRLFVASFTDGNAEAATNV